MFTLINVISIMLLVYSGLGIFTLSILTLSTLLAWPKLRQSRPVAPETRFAIVIAAHNEASCIEETLSAVAALEYPPDRFQTIVVADNCTDATAHLARQAGARVLERHDPQHRGKGYALRLAFDTLIQEAFDAMVVIDADSHPTANLLRVFASKLAEGSRCIQCRNAVGNPEGSPIAWLLALGNMLDNDFYHEARARFGLPTMLRGNGMCLAVDVVRGHPWQAYSVTEDTEYGLTLLEHGIRTDYTQDAAVLSRFPETSAQLLAQRRRWAAGNAHIANRRLPILFGRALAERNILLADAAWSLLITSKPQLLLGILIPTMAGLLPGNASLAVWGGVELVLLAGVVVAGARRMPQPQRNLRSLSGVITVFGGLMLSLGLALLGAKCRDWTRTPRS